MPGRKISALTGGGAAQATDEFVVARAGGNNKITGADIAAAATSVGTLSSLTVSGNLAVDTNTLFVDAANNRVGVGTASPAVPLHTETTGISTSAFGNVISTFRSQAAGRDVSLQFSDGSTQSYFGMLSGSLRFAAGTSTTQLMLDASGNLGLGVTPSGWDSGFQVLENAGGSFSSGSNGAARLLQNAYYGTVSGVGDWRYKFTGTAASRYEMNGGEHRFFNASAGTAGNAILWAQAMTLDANGNLLVGLTSTVGAAKAAVAGTILSSTNTLSTFSGAYGGFDWVSRSLRIFSGSADATNSQIEFYAGVSGAINERFRIKGPGQVRFIPLGAAPTTNVEDGDVYYDSGTNKLRVRAGGAWTDLH